MTINRKVFDRASSASSVLTSLMDGNAVSAKGTMSAIGTIKTLGGKLDNMIHGTAVACIYLSMSVAEGGPATGAAPAAALLNSMPKGSRAKALAAWFTAFSNVRLKFDKGTKLWTAGVIGDKLKSYALPQPDAAMAKPFWTVEEADTDPVAFSPIASLLALLNRAAIADTKGKLTEDDKAVIAALKGIPAISGAVKAAAAAKEAAKA